MQQVHQLRREPYRLPPVWRPTSPATFKSGIGHCTDNVRRTTSTRTLGKAVRKSRQQSTTTSGVPDLSVPVRTVDPTLSSTAEHSPTGSSVLVTPPALTEVRFEYSRSLTPKSTRDMSNLSDVSDVEEAPLVFARAVGSRLERAVGEMDTAESVDVATDVAPHLPPSHVAEHRDEAGSSSTVQDTTTPTRENKTAAVVPTSASSTAMANGVRSMPRVVNDLEIVNFFSANPAADALMFVNVAQQAGVVPPGTEATLLLEQATRVKSIMHTFSSNLLIRQAQVGLDPNLGWNPDTFLLEQLVQQTGQTQAFRPGANS